jgi:preprotein translocase subunit SecG
MLLIFTFIVITILFVFIILLLLHIGTGQNIWGLGGFGHHNLFNRLAIPLRCNQTPDSMDKALMRALILSDTPPNSSRDPKVGLGVK